MKIAVFCGSRLGEREEYAQAAREVGAALARHNLGMVYGGTKSGLMREASRACREAGGEVVGVMATGLGEVADADVSAMKFVPTLAERKWEMAELSAGFLTLPGGLGTLDEWSEVVTWGMVGLHAKPIALLNTGGFYDSFLAFLDRAVEDGFWKPAYRDALIVDDDASRIVSRLAQVLEAR